MRQTLDTLKAIHSKHNTLSNESVLHLLQEIVEHVEALEPTGKDPEKTRTNYEESNAERAGEITPRVEVSNAEAGGQNAQNAHIDAVRRAAQTRGAIPLCGQGQNAHVEATHVPENADVSARIVSAIDAPHAQSGTDERAGEITPRVEGQNADGESKK